MVRAMWTIWTSSTFLPVAGQRHRWRLAGGAVDGSGAIDESWEASGR
jgi:hypothetical protein